MVNFLTEPCLIKGDIMHKRFLPKVNKFNYKSIYISCPINKINDLKSRLFSINKFNLFSFYKKQYGEKSTTDIESWIYKILKQNKISNITNIILVTHPTILGYCFNPVSFWLCFNESEELIAILSEVRNTCKQKHQYLCFNKDLSKINPDSWLKSKKEFYVSPFFKIEGEYLFKFEITDKKMNFFINYLNDDKLQLATYLKCSPTKLSDKNLLIAFCKIPFATIKTTILIHYQALKLLIKSIKFYKCPPILNKNITIARNEK